MSENIEDIIQGHSISVTFDGTTYTRIVTVKDVAGDGDQKIINAIDDSGFTIGDSYPGVANALLEVITGVPVDSTTVKLTLKYNAQGGFSGEGSTNQISSTGTLRQTETNIDFEGALIGVSYDYPEDYLYL